MHGATAEDSFLQAEEPDQLDLEDVNELTAEHVPAYKNQLLAYAIEAKHNALTKADELGLDANQINQELAELEAEQSAIYTEYDVPETVLEEEALSLFATPALVYEKLMQP